MLRRKQTKAIFPASNFAKAKLLAYMHFCKHFYIKNKLKNDEI